MPTLDSRLFGYWTFRLLHSDSGNGFFFIREDGRYIGFSESPELTYPRNAPVGWLVQRYYLDCPSDSIIKFHLKIDDLGVLHRYYFQKEKLFLQRKDKIELHWECEKSSREDIDSDLIDYLDIRIDYQKPNKTIESTP